MLFVHYHFVLFGNHLTIKIFLVILLDEPTRTIDVATLHQIPLHLTKFIRTIGKIPTQEELLKSLLLSLALECGFIGEWCCEDDEDLKKYNLSWNYSFDRQLLVDFATFPQNNDDDHQLLMLKFGFRPQIKIVVHCLGSGDLLLVSAYNFEMSEDSSMTSTVSSALLISRYIPNRRLNKENLPSNFRNLNELSINVKNQIFLPLRNNIYTQSPYKSVYPSLNGIPEEALLKIFSYIKLKDVVALSCCSKAINLACLSFFRNKSKKG